MSEKNILALSGDGIGPEIMDMALDVLSAAAKKTGLSIKVEKDDIGGTAYDRYGVPLADETLDKARDADAVSVSYTHLTLPTIYSV